MADNLSTRFATSDDVAIMSKLMQPMIQLHHQQHPDQFPHPETAEELEEYVSSLIENPAAVIVL